MKKEKEQKGKFTEELKEVKNKILEDQGGNDKVIKEINEKVKELNSKIILEEKAKQELVNKEKGYLT